MEILNNIIFYIICLLLISGIIIAVFSRCMIYSAIGAVIVFFCVSGLYFLLNAPFLGAVQIALWTVGIGIVLMFCVMLTNKSEDIKTSIVLRPITIIAPVLCILFAVIILPFILNAFADYNMVHKISIEQFSVDLYKHASLAFEITGLMIFSALIGISALFINKKNNK